MKTLGIVLILFGILAFLYKGITYTSRDTSMDTGATNTQISSMETRGGVPLSPILGGIALVSGIALVVAANRSEHHHRTT